MKQSAVFLDRDGVINPDPGFINDPDDLVLYPYTAEAIRKFNSMGFKVLVVTNQSGIARGLISVNQLENIHNTMISRLKKQNAYIDKIYYSPYHIKGNMPSYNVQHIDRKPEIGMFKKACSDFELDPSMSYMIGDRLSDMIFAHRAGLTPILVFTGDGKDDLLKMVADKSDFMPKYVAQDILAASWLIESLKKER